MKKIIPVISPLIIGLLSAWFIEFFLCVASIVMSPFANLEESQFLIFCGIASLVSVLIIIVVVVADVMFLIELNNKKKFRLVLILQACAMILICFVSWYYAEQIINALYNLF